MYRPTQIGSLLYTNPAAAHAKLQKLFARHKTVGAVAKAIGVNRDTIRVWVNRLVGAGYSDPKVQQQTETVH